MKPRATVRQADITRAIKAAENAGWARGSFRVRVGPDGAIELLPIDAEADEAADIARRIEGAMQ